VLRHRHDQQRQLAKIDLDSCKACQQIDILRALPLTLTTLVLGNNSDVSLTVPK